MRIINRLVAALVVVAAALSPFAAWASPTQGVNADVNIRVNGAYYGATNLGTPSLALDVLKLMTITAGTGTGKADRLFAGSRTIAASSSENLDLAGTLTDPLGATLTFVHVKALLVIADAANTNSVLVGGAASNGFAGPFADVTDIATIPPGGSALFTHPGAGWTVTAATGDILKVANSSSGTGVTYRVVIIGTSN
jgi:hypothetical protein